MGVHYRHFFLLIKENSLSDDVFSLEDIKNLSKLDANKAHKLRHFPIRLEKRKCRTNSQSFRKATDPSLFSQSIAKL